MKKYVFISIVIVVLGFGLIFMSNILYVSTVNSANRLCIYYPETCYETYSLISGFLTGIFAIGFAMIASGTFSAISISLRRKEVELYS